MAKLKIEQVKTESELSETPIIEEEQPTAPVENEATVDKTAKTAPKVTAPDETTKRPPPMPRSIDDIPTTKRPIVAKEPEYVEPAQPVICAGCKATVDAETTKKCLNCPGSLRFCPSCAKPGSCHKCGKGLSK